MKKGRPKKVNPRDKIVGIRLTKGQFEVLNSMVKSEGYKSVSDWIYKLILGFENEHGRSDFWEL